MLRAASTFALALSLALVASCEPTTASTPQADGRRVTTWRFAIEETRGSVQDAYAQRFKQLVEQRSGGSVRVVVYPYGALGTSDNILEQVHNGTLQLAMASPGHLGKLIPEVQAFLLHFVLSDDEDVNACALADAAVKSAIDALYREKGLRFLDVFSEGFMVWTTQKPVREPADFAGMKFRVMTSPLLIAAYQAYGASPTPLPYSEVYSALQLRMIDGQVNPVFAIQEMSFYEVTEWLVFPRAAPFVATVVGSPELFEAMNAEQRKMLEAVLAELHDYVDDVQRRFNRERLQLIRDKKPQLQSLVLDEAQRGRFRAAAAPVREAYVQLAGPRGAQLLATLEDAVRRAERCRAPRADEP